MRKIHYKDFKPQVTWSTQFFCLPLPSFCAFPAHIESKDEVFRRVQVFVQQIESEGKEFRTIEMRDFEVESWVVRDANMRVWFMETV